MSCMGDQLSGRQKNKRMAQGGTGWRGVAQGGMK